MIPFFGYEVKICCPKSFLQTQSSGLCLRELEALIYSKDPDIWKASQYNPICLQNFAITVESDSIRVHSLDQNGLISVDTFSSCHG